MALKLRSLRVHTPVCVALRYFDTYQHFPSLSLVHHKISDALNICNPTLEASSPSSQSSAVAVQWRFRFGIGGVEGRRRLLVLQRWTRTTRKMRRGRVRMQKKQSIMADPFSSSVHVAVLIRECQLLFRCEFTPFGNRNEKRTHTVQTNVLRPLFRTDGSILRFPLCFRVMNIIPATRGSLLRTWPACDRFTD